MFHAKKKMGKVGKVGKVGKIQSHSRAQAREYDQTSQPNKLADAAVIERFADQLSLVSPIEGITRSQINRRLAELGQMIERGQKEIHLYSEILNLRNDLRALPTRSTRSASKGNLLKEFLISKPEGVSYHEINSYLASRGASVSLNFAYNLIHKWGKLVEKKDGKLFWVGEAEKEKMAVAA